MDIKTDTSRILMSDELRDRLPEELINSAQENEPESLLERFVTASVTLQGVGDPFVGVLLGLESTRASMTITIQMNVEQAFAVIEAGANNVTGVVIELGERVFKPVVSCADAVSIDNVSSIDQLCTLSLRFVVHS